MEQESGTIYFSKKSHEYGYLSNMHIAPFIVDEIEYKTTEQYFQAAKARQFKDDGVLREILKCEDPVQAKRLGKKVKQFNREEWDEVKEDIMKQANIHKFAGNPALREKLIATGKRHLAECIARDRTWAIGTSQAKAEANGSYPGWNLMGLILEDVRKQLQDQPKHDLLRQQALEG